MFDSGLLNFGEIYDFEFTSLTAGFAYEYTCVLHEEMDGVIRVARYGDANLDGFVNLEDFNILAANFGTSGPPWEGGDFNEDGVVNLEDFNLLAANFGKLIEPAPNPLIIGFGVAAPEPAIIPFLALAVILLRTRESKNLNLTGREPAGPGFSLLSIWFPSTPPAAAEATGSPPRRRHAAYHAKTQESVLSCFS
jgi:hypothetical protein